MEAKPGLPERVRSNAGLGITAPAFFLDGACGVFKIRARDYYQTFRLLPETQFSIKVYGVVALHVHVLTRNSGN